MENKLALEVPPNPPTNSLTKSEISCLNALMKVWGGAWHTNGTQLVLFSEHCEQTFKVFLRTYAPYRTATIQSKTDFIPKVSNGWKLFDFKTLPVK
jgi:hypothetical protein